MIGNALAVGALGAAVFMLMYVCMKIFPPYINSIICFGMAIAARKFALSTYDEIVSKPSAFDVKLIAEPLVGMSNSLVYLAGAAMVLTCGYAAWNVYKNHVKAKSRKPFRLNWPKN